MSIRGVIDDHILAKYRELLDAESTAFYEIEHAYEEGDREHFQSYLIHWKNAIEAKLDYLESCGVNTLT